MTHDTVYDGKITCGIPCLSALVCMAVLPLVTYPALASELTGSELRFDDAPVRTHLESDLPPRKPPPPTEEDINAFRQLAAKGTAREAERVAWVLGDWPGPLNAGLLLQILENPSPKARAQAARSSGRLSIHMDESVYGTVTAKLEELLEKDPENEVKREALTALGRLGAESASGLAARYALSPDPGLAAAALKTLGSLNAVQKAEIVAGRANDENPGVAAAAVTAAASISSKATIEALSGNLNSTYGMLRSRSAWALGKLDAHEKKTELLALLEDELGSVRREALLALESLELIDTYRDRIPAMLNDPDSSVRRAAAGVVKRRQMVQFIPNLFEALGDPHGYVRNDAAPALAALAELEREQVVELAAAGLASETDTVREGSSRILGKLASDRALERHIGLLKDPHLPARRWAAWALGEIGRPQAIPALHETAFPEKRTGPEADIDLRSSAILALGKLGHADMTPLLARIIPQKPTIGSPGKPTLLRRSCIRAIGYMGLKDQMRLLLRRFEDLGGANDDPELEEVRGEAVVALARIGAVETLDSILEHMKFEGSGPELQSLCRWAVHRLTGEWPDYQVRVRQPRNYYFISVLERKR